MTSPDMETTACQSESSSGGSSTLDRAELIWGTYVSPLVCLFGIACNALNLIILTRRNMTGSPYTYLLGLSVTDITVLSLSLVENTLSKPLGRGVYFWQFYEAFLFQPIANVFSNSSVWITVLLTIERYISVRFPLKAKKWCTRCLARRSIVLTVLISVIINIPRFRVTEVLPCTPCSQTSTSNPLINNSFTLHPSPHNLGPPASHLELQEFPDLTFLHENHLVESHPTTLLPQHSQNPLIFLPPNDQNLATVQNSTADNGCHVISRGSRSMVETSNCSIIRNHQGIFYETRSTMFAKSDYFVAWTWLYISIIHFIPCCLVLYLNVSLITIVYQANRRRISLRGSPCWSGGYDGYESAIGGCYSKEQIRLTITCISIICLFLVCIVPSAFSNKAVAKALFGQGQTMDQFTQGSFYRLFRVTTNLLVYCNLSMNFILYCVFNHKFLYTLRRLGHTYLFRALHPNHPHESVPSTGGGGNSSGGMGGGQGGKDSGEGGKCGGAVVRDSGRLHRISSTTSGYCGGTTSLVLQVTSHQPDAQPSVQHQASKKRFKSTDCIRLCHNKQSVKTRRCSSQRVKFESLNKRTHDLNNDNHFVVSTKHRSDLTLHCGVKQCEQFNEHRQPDRTKSSNTSPCAQSITSAAFLSLQTAQTLSASVKPNDQTTISSDALQTSDHSKDAPSSASQINLRDYLPMCGLENQNITKHESTTMRLDISKSDLNKFSSVIRSAVDDWRVKRSSSSQSKLARTGEELEMYISVTSDPVMHRSQTFNQKLIYV